MRTNETSRYVNDFPFISYCGRERNYLRCDDLPLVVTKLILDDKSDRVQINTINSSNWTLGFDPSNLYHNSETGRLYYFLEDTVTEIALNQNQISPDKNANKASRSRRHFETLPCKVALVKSEISINLMKNMEFVKNENDKNFVYRFEFKSKFYDLNSDHKARELIKKFSAFKEKNSS